MASLVQQANRPSLVGRFETATCGTANTDEFSFLQEICRSRSNICVGVRRKRVVVPNATTIGEHGHTTSMQVRLPWEVYTDDGHCKPVMHVVNDRPPRATPLSLATASKPAT